VRECAVLRKLIEVSTEIADSALNRMGKDVGQLLDEAESKVFQIAEAGARTRQGFIEIQPLLTQVMERIDLLYHKDNLRTSPAFRPATATSIARPRDCSRVT